MGSSDTGDRADDVKVERTVELDAPADLVWQALTDDALLSEWFDADVELDPRRGGTGCFREAEGGVRRAVVEEVEPGRRLSFRWWPEDDRAGVVSVVELEVGEVGGRTLLHVVERPLHTPVGASASSVVARLDARWADTLVRLEAWCSALVCV